LSRRSDVEKMVRREAREHRFVVEKVGQEWKVTNPRTSLSQCVPERAAGRELANARSKIRQLSTRTPMHAAVAADPLGEEGRTGGNWEIQELVAAAYRSGVSFDVEHGRLRINAHIDNRSWVDVLRRREAEVMEFLLGDLARRRPPDPEPAPVSETPQGADESMPKIGDVAHIDGGTRKEDLAGDARALYDVLRELAEKQGDEKGTNARIDGVLWTGTLASVLRTVGHGWAATYADGVSGYLRDTRHIKCQRRSNPSIWWIRGTWDDDHLTVTRRLTPTDAPARNTPAPGRASEPSAAVPPPADEYAQLMKLLGAGRTAAATIDRLEGKIAGLRREVEEKDGMFLSVRAELSADVEALQAENRQLRGELAKLEPFKQFIKAVKEADL
jgi:hypothetical protein